MGFDHDGVSEGEKIEPDPSHRRVPASTVAAQTGTTADAPSRTRHEGGEANRRSLSHSGSFLVDGGPIGPVGVAHQRHGVGDLGRRAAVSRRAGRVRGGALREAPGEAEKRRSRRLRRLRSARAVSVDPVRPGAWEHKAAEARRRNAENPTIGRSRFGRGVRARRSALAHGRASADEGRVGRIEARGGRDDRAARREGVSRRHRPGRHPARRSSAWRRPLPGRRRDGRRWCCGAPLGPSRRPDAAASRHAWSRKIRRPRRARAVAAVSRAARTGGM